MEKTENMEKSKNSKKFFDEDLRTLEKRLNEENKSKKSNRNDKNKKDK